jgi:methylated-DNA-[protein]-cysteine S-methyltransferase
MQYWIYRSDIGETGIAEEAGALAHIWFAPAGTPLPFPESGSTLRETPLLADAAGQIRRYLAGELFEFDLPLAPGGTPFMQAVWSALRSIPYGERTSYSAIAAAIGRPNAVRAVGMANHRNPLPLVIPCHRVVGKNGSLVGYAGGLALKETLLSIESAALARSARERQQAENTAKIAENESGGTNE